MFACSWKGQFERDGSNGIKSVNYVSATQVLSATVTYLEKCWRRAF